MTEAVDKFPGSAHQAAKRAHDYFLSIRLPDPTIGDKLRAVRNEAEDFLSVYDQGLVGSAWFFGEKRELLDNLQTRSIVLQGTPLWKRITRDPAYRNDELEHIQFHVRANEYTVWAISMSFDPGLRGNPLIPKKSSFIKISNSLIPRLKTEWVWSDPFLHPSYKVTTGDSTYTKYHTNKLNDGVHSKTCIDTNKKGQITGIDSLIQDRIGQVLIAQKVELNREAGEEIISDEVDLRSIDALRQILDTLPFDKLPRNT